MQSKVSIIIAAITVAATPAITLATIEFPMHFRYGVPGSTVTVGSKSTAIDQDGNASLCCFPFASGKSYSYQIEKEGYIGKYDSTSYVTQNPISVNANIIAECEYSDRPNAHYSYDVPPYPKDEDSDGLNDICDCDDNDKLNKINKREGACPTNPIDTYVPTHCSDTDIDNDLYFQGSVYLNGAKIPKQDYCQGLSVVQADCKNGELSWATPFPCPSGTCAYGECIPDQQSGRPMDSIDESVPMGDTFSDIDESDEFADAIMTLFDIGVIDGYPDGTFKPFNTINRAELMKMIMAYFYNDRIINTSSCFLDVFDEWFAPFVCTARRFDIIAGYDDGSFRPGQTLNHAEGIKIIMNVMAVPSNSNAKLPRDVPASEWYAPFVRSAVSVGVISADELFNPGAPLKRFEVTEWIYRALRTR